MQRTKIINSLIEKNNYTSYLEIGFGDGVNFQTVVCEKKIAVDPTPFKMEEGLITTTSDDFFNNNKIKYDLIFIDGLHHSDQVERDIINGYKALNKGGMLLIHDCNPWEEVITRIPRETLAWTGDVFRAVAGFIESYQDSIVMNYFEERAGLFAINKKPRISPKAGFTLSDLTYEDWVKDGHQDRMIGL